MEVAWRATRIWYWHRKMTIVLKPADRSKHMEIMLPEEGIRAFQMWEKKSDKTEY